MKTPKELLLGRHQGIESKLNAARQNALATLTKPSLAQSWREFLLSIRWHLAGMSAVWLAVFVLNAGSSSSAAASVADNKIPSARVILTALLKNRRELMEMTGAATPSEPAAPPPRRTEIESKVEYV